MESTRTKLIEYDYILKLILIGDTNTGKSTILHNYINLRKNYVVTDPTIGVDFGTRIITLHDNKKVKLQCWDTAGQEKYRCIVRSYFRDVCAVLLVFDVTNPMTFYNLPFWLNEIKMHKSCRNHDHPILLIGTKIDKRYRKISKEQALHFAENNNLLYVEINALECDTMDNIMSQLTSRILEKFKEEPCRGVKAINNIMMIDNNDETDEDSNNKKICCSVM